MIDSSPGLFADPSINPGAEAHRVPFVSPVAENTVVAIWVFKVRGCDPQ